MKKIFLIILILSAQKSNAQRFTIIAAEDGAALPFATMVNLTHPNIVSANVNGIANLTAQNGDSISISYVGFKKTTFIFNSDTTTNIRLFKEAEVLPNITVVKCKKMKQFKYSNKNDAKFIMKNGTRYYFDGLGWWDFRWKNSEYAIRINPEKENTILKSFSFWLKKSPFGPKNAINAPLIISFYEVTDSITPGNLLIEKPLFYYPQKIGKQTINLDSFHLIIPPNGIYVSFQCVTNEDYAWTKPIKMIGSTKDSIIKCYGGTIEGLYSSNFEIAGFNPIKNSWFLFSKNTENDLFPSVKCEAVLKYCED